MQQKYSQQNALLAKQCHEGLYHMMASATLTRGDGTLVLFPLLATHDGTSYSDSKHAGS